MTGVGYLVQLVKANRSSTLGNHAGWSSLSNLPPPFLNLLPIPGPTEPDSESGGGGGSGRVRRREVAATFGPIVADHLWRFGFRRSPSRLDRVVAHDLLEVIVETSMSITNPAQLVAE